MTILKFYINVFIKFIRSTKCMSIPGYIILLIIYFNIYLSGTSSHINSRSDRCVKASYTYIPLVITITF